MKTGTAALQAAGNDPRVELTVIEGSLNKPTNTPLAECVRASLTQYLEHLGDHDAEELYAMVLREVERPMLEVVLEHTGGNQTHSARLLGMSRSTLRKKLAHYDIG